MHQFPRCSSQILNYTFRFANFWRTLKKWMEPENERLKEIDWKFRFAQNHETSLLPTVQGMVPENLS